MNKVVKGIFFSLVLLSTIGASLAVDAEYKNSLSKVELTKINEDNYSINLYTQKKYSEPVKVIKKNDLSYYILLPETKNTTQNTGASSGEIRNVSTTMYPYAGQDINNGYTKININTTKPVNFNINIKNLSERTTQKPLIKKDELKVSQIKQEKAFDNQKKNLETTAPAKALTNKTEKKIEIKKVEVPKKVKLAKTKTSKVISDKIQASKDIALAAKFDIPKEIELTPPSVLDEIEQEKNNIVQQQSLEIEQEKSVEKNINSNKLSNLKHSIASRLIKAKTKIKQTVKNHLKELINMSIALFVAIIGFVSMLFFLKSRRNPQPKLIKKAELLKEETTTKKEPNDKYFTFDKNTNVNINKNNFCSSITPKVKKYELSSYNPKNNNDCSFPTIEPYGKKIDENRENEIIQKILQDDTFIDFKTKMQETKEIAPVNIKLKDVVLEEFTPTEEIEKNIKSKKDENVTTPVKENYTLQSIKENNETEESEQTVAEVEPAVLSKIEFSPECGLMCVSYNNKISLIGYIFDNIYVLHNFKTPELENYEIKYRLAEKDEENISHYIVKIEQTRLLIKVEKTSMSVELVM